MGMDMYLYRARAEKAINDYLDSMSYTNEPFDWQDDNTNVPVAEVYYSRKFWDLYHAMSFTKDYDCGQYLRLTKKEIKEMLDYSILHPDYFGDFSTVEKLCRIYYKYDEWEDKGYHIFFECDW